MMKSNISETSKHFHQQCMDQGISDLGKVANAMDVCMAIRKSDSEKWKDALNTKLKETTLTLDKMLMRCKVKEGGKLQHGTNPAMEVIARSHRQRRRVCENDTRSNTVMEEHKHTTSENGF